MIENKFQRSAQKALLLCGCTFAFLFSSSFFNPAYAGCVQSGSLNIDVEYDCTGDFSSGAFYRSGLFFRDGEKVLGQNAEISIYNLTADILPPSGVMGLRALTFASANPYPSNLVIEVTGAAGTGGDWIGTSGNYAHGLYASSNGNGAINPADNLVFNVGNGGRGGGITIETLAENSNKPLYISTAGGTAH